MRGLPVTAGSPAFANLVANDDAFAVAQLRAAGAICLGLTNMPPMAAGGMQRGLYGRAESPYSAGFLTSAFGSGSSNGSGTATAASFAAFGLAEETWSSGRRCERVGRTVSRRSSEMLMTEQVFDFFAHRELPTPTLGIDEVRRLMGETFGLACTVTELGSQQDQNFVVSDTENTAPIGVLKLSNPAFSEAEIELQDLAAKTVAEREPTLRIPQVVTGPRGPMSAWWNTSQGRIHARVITHVSGVTLMGSGYLSPATVARMGELAAKVSVALADLRHPASARVLQWDLRHAERVIATLAPDEPDTEVRQFASTVAESAQRRLERARLAPAHTDRALRHHRRQRDRYTRCAARCRHRLR